MYKIYSRYRIKWPQKLNSKKGKRMLKVIVILMIAFLVAKLILDSILPVFDKMCEEKAMSIATVISNNKATEVMAEHTYDEIFTIEKDKNGNIAMIKSNVIPINEIISDVAVKIQEELEKREDDNIQIPLGAITGFKLLAGTGPNINIKIIPAGSVETDLRSEFVEQGINQTLHRVYLQVDCQVTIVTPYNEISKKISNQVLLIENVIIGNIPSTYLNIKISCQKPRPPWQFSQNVVKLYKLIK